MSETPTAAPLGWRCKRHKTPATLTGRHKDSLGRERNYRLKSEGCDCGCLTASGPGEPLCDLEPIPTEEELVPRELVDPEAGPEEPERSYVELRRVLEGVRALVDPKGPFVTRGQCSEELDKALRVLARLEGLG